MDDRLFNLFWKNSIILELTHLYLTKKEILCTVSALLFSLCLLWDVEMVIFLSSHLASSYPFAHYLLYLSVWYASVEKVCLKHTTFIQAILNDKIFQSYDCQEIHSLLY